MKEREVYPCNKRVWRKFALVSAAIGFFFLLTILFVPYDFDFFIYLYAGVFGCISFLSWAIGSSQYVLHNGTITFQMPKKSFNVPVDHAGSPVVLNLRKGKRQLMHVLTRKRGRVIFDVEDHAKFEEAVRALLKPSDARELSTDAHYVGIRILDLLFIFSGACSFLMGLFSWILIGGLAWMFSVFMLLLALPLLVFGLLSYVNVKASRTGTKLQCHNFLGNLVLEIELEEVDRLEFTGLFLPIMQFDAKSFQVPARLLTDRNLMYDMFAIIDGDFEFNDTPSEP